MTAEEPRADQPRNGGAPFLSAAPALACNLREACWLDPATGEVEILKPREAANRLGGGSAIRPIVCHAQLTARRLRSSGLPVLDALELFAFVHPARFCAPTPKGLAEALELPPPGNLEQEAETLLHAAANLLRTLEERDSQDWNAAAIGFAMGRSGWPWASNVLAALGKSGMEEAPHSRNIRQGLRVWTRLPEWEDGDQPQPPESWPVDAAEARARLNKLLGRGSERREQQTDYAGFVAQAFSPREEAGKPNLVLAEAGTGVGKTLGYVAPASVWAEKNGGTVWLSTFTRNLQRQLDTELTRLYPDPAERRSRVVIRKGRENYFCLLNFEEAVDRIGPRGGREVIALGLVARWAAATRDGDMAGGDFPAWLAGLLGRGLTTDMTDTRGECVYAGCPHYHKCFIEHSQRRAKYADIVVANHALVMIQAALGGLGGDVTHLPPRYVFDEGHHLFNAADGAFSAHLSGHEMADLRRWLVGAEQGDLSRSKGLRRRAEDLLIDDDGGLAALSEVLERARALAGPGWRQRLAGGEPRGPAEAFLSLVRTQVHARTDEADSSYDLEAPARPPINGLLEAGGKLDEALSRLGAPTKRLMNRLLARLERDADELDTNTRNRIESLCRSLERRLLGRIADWRAMLESLSGDAPDGFVDWMAVDRQGGADIDVGLHRHHVDPMKPFAEVIGEKAHGMLVTSATLKDRTGDEDTDWGTARARSGATYLKGPRHELAVASPFDHAERTRVFVVGDVDWNDPARLAAAYRELFMASGGGALGLFTAIQRLRAVYEKIASPLDEAGIVLYAQHVDPLDTGSLIDIFRADDDACLLGTDAVRDGVDVPGRSLRLIVFDRVPWPRPGLLHKARRNAFGGRRYDEMLVRLKLTQAYGRLLRRAADKGVFVMLDRRLPSRLANAFPPDVRVERLGLKAAVAGIRAFLSDET